jgi:ribonucleoside-diphosphate reductase alpha chain
MQPLKVAHRVQTDPSRDALLRDFGKKTLEDRYLLPGEGYQDMFARVATAYTDDAAHAQRVYDYISKLWFMPSTPVLSNGGAGRGLPISCFLNSVEDNMAGIVNVWNENVSLASQGGGIGTSWSCVRSIGEPVRGAGQTSGIIPFIRVMDSLTLAISQGSLRRGSAAVYLDVHHPEIEEFLEIRKPSGDFNRKSLNLHHGIMVTDEFMEAVRAGAAFGLRSPKTNEVLRTVDARALWQKILEIRLQTGEPYLVFADTANRAMPKHQRELGLKVSQSNLCSEIMLHSGKDHLGVERTAVCCLASVNAETYLEWCDHPGFVEDIMRFLDNVLQDFIDRAPPEMTHAVYAATRERSVGLGLMGFHSFLQSQGVPFESVMAKSWNKRMFRRLRLEADMASKVLAIQRGPCPDAADRGAMERFSHKLAVAPTASISIICGGTSAGIEPIPANIYTHKTLSGSFQVRNPYLETLLADRAATSAPFEYLGSFREACEMWVERQWESILEHGGSVQHLDYMTKEEKDTYKTAFELDQRWVIELAADRAPDIDQGQSVNVFLPGDVDKWDLHNLHWRAWETGVKSLYYLRSTSVQRAQFAGSDGEESEAKTSFVSAGRRDYEECLACQ